MGVLKAKVAGNWVDVGGPQPVTISPVYWRCGWGGQNFTGSLVAMTPVNPRGNGFTIVGTRIRCDIAGSYLLQFQLSTTGTAGSYCETQMQHWRGSLLSTSGAVSHLGVWNENVNVNVLDLQVGDEIQMAGASNVTTGVDSRSSFTITAVGTSVYSVPTTDPELQKLLQCQRNGWYAFRAYRTGAFNIGVSPGETYIPYDVEEYDYANAYDPTTGIYVAPVTGLYEIGGHLCWVVGVTNEHIELQVRVDGLFKGDSNKGFYPAGSAPAVIVDTDLRLVAGQQLRLSVGHYTGSGTPALHVSNPANTGSRNYFAARLVSLG